MQSGPKLARGPTVPAQAEIREFYEPGKGAAIAVIRAMPEGKARAKLARRLGLAGDEIAPKGLQ